MKNNFKKLIAVILCILLAYPVGIITAFAGITVEYEPEAKYDNPIEVHVCELSTLYGYSYSIEEYVKYNYSTSKKNQMSYIIHFLSGTIQKKEPLYHMEGYDEQEANATEMYVVGFTYFTDEGIRGTSILYADEWGKEGNYFSAIKYPVDIKGRNRLLDIINGFKTGRLVLPDEITFTPSDWAKTNVDEAIEKGLVPKINRVNYVNNISRLEMCQLAEALLEAKGYNSSQYTESPFKDTSDCAVSMLCSLGIIEGTGSDTFKPYEPITEDEFCRVTAGLYKVLSGKAIDDRTLAEAVAYDIQAESPTKEQAIITMLRLYNRLTATK